MSILSNLHFVIASSIVLGNAHELLNNENTGNISSEIYGTFVIFSVKLTLSMQIIGFCVRLSSSLLWIQMYKLGVSYIDCSVPREADTDMRNSFLNPATPITRQPSHSDDALGGSVYDPAYYSSLFEDEIFNNADNKDPLADA
ncbi:hypothetical protein HAX54_033390 [Datura stramonium]|uniref:Uncharacterized protein n=1 Tax=Datura stramonium TaxID=4076 RepID=A0ABS8SDD8_DATST|nr:hypothetical protein [Datura stramonium]